MVHRAVAFDFDGTLATDGIVPNPTLNALRELRESGCRLVLVTGREVADLRATFDQENLFDVLIVENGAVQVEPGSRTSRLLAAPPSDTFIEALRARGIAPLSIGQVIVATRSPHRAAVQSVIAQLGLPLDVILNKGAVMVLPRGIDKGTGVAAAAIHLNLPLTSVIGVGDAENDKSLLSACGLGVAVANAVPALKEQADWITPSPSGAGVVELIDRLLGADVFLTRVPSRL